ncbi:MAG TPA: biotin/lipoyl-binding protein [Streptosporangiaceae bacterium]|nr:biotin/lipoyl-binding protein [Streptosporangiaceae bacterium]
MRTSSRERAVPYSRRLSRPKIALAAAVTVLAAAALMTLFLTRPAGSAGTITRVVPVVRTTLSQTLSASGTIEPKKSATLSFSAAGQVIAVEATAGERVASGQPLASMDSPTLKAQAAQAEASLASAQSQLTADQSSSRASSAQLAADQASVDAAQSQVSSADAALSGAALTAPFDGIVTGTGGLTIGQQISGGGGSGAGSGSGSGSGSASGPGSGDGGSGDSGNGGSGSGSGSSTGEITVVSAHDIVTASVDASVVGRIKAGDQVVISTAGAAGPVRGTVHSVGLIADTSSGVATFPVVIDVSGTPPGLYAGASATIAIIYHQVRNALVVPSGAIRPSSPHTVVDVLSGGHRVARDVTTGLTSGGLTQVTSGLAAGDRVVVTFQRISAGTPANRGTFVGPAGRIVHFQRARAGFVPGGG